MDQELEGWLRANGYRDLRVLPDETIIGTIDLLYTRGLVVGLDRWGYEHRYCYPERPRASEAAAAMQSGDDSPLDGYVAERHRGG